MTTSSRFQTLTVACSVLAAFLLVAAGCGDAAEPEEATEGAEIEIVQAERSPEIPGASARIESPSGGEVVSEASPLTITTAVDSFEAGAQTDTPRAQNIANSENGQHLHVIVDNEPYMANYEPGGDAFDVGNLELGPHTIIAFPSRSYHESVKNSGAMDYVNFYVGEEGDGFMFNPDQPTAIYSRPKGSYSGEGADSILVDFYLHNVELGADGYKVRYSVHEGGMAQPDTTQGGMAQPDTTGLASIELTEWTPAFITGLQSGTYTVRMQLIGPDGTVVPGDFNDTMREIQVQAASDTTATASAQTTGEGME